MTILVDTNVLLRMSQPEHPQFAISRDSLRVLRFRSERLILVPQVIYEFWVASTRPLDVNGLGLAASQALAKVEDNLAMYPLYHDDRDVFGAWRELVIKYGIQGKQAHDARLVAAMVRHGVTHLLTFNGQDFARFSEIAVIAPADAAAFPAAEA